MNILFVKISPPPLRLLAARNHLHTAQLPGVRAAQPDNTASAVRIQWFSLVRILGITLVLIYHFFKEKLPGGFFGVDVFFVFSGYLITALLVSEVRRKGSFKFAAFIRRRFLRTFPPLALAVLCTLPFTLLIDPDFTGGIGRQAAAALSFVTNYFEILSGGSYEAQLLPHLYVHTWSLALEMQYYLLWGLLCAGLVFIVRKYMRKATARQRHTFVRAGITAASLVLTGLCYWNMRALFAQSAGADPSPAYFASTSRGLPFFIGSAAGALFGMELGEKATGVLRKKSAGVLSILLMGFSAAGLAAMSALLGFSDPGTYRYGIPLASLLAALLICGARALHGAAPHVREPKVLTAAADLSYGVFLAHWPFYVVFGELAASNGIAALGASAASLLFAAVLFYGVEPLLRGKRPWKKAPAFRRVLIKDAYAALATLLVFALLLTAQVFWAAPEVTALEQGILNGMLYQRADEVRALSYADAIRPPVDQKSAVIPGFADAPPDYSYDGWLPSVVVPAIPGGVTVLGDSITVDARAALLQSIPNCEVDALSSRSLALGYEIMMQMRREETLREILVVALGTNGVDEFAEFIQKIIDDLPPGHKLVFVTPFDGRTPKGRAYRTAVAERAIAPAYDFVTLADWHAVIKGQEKLLTADKVHLGTNDARRIYVNVIAQAIQTASLGPKKPDPNKIESEDTLPQGVSFLGDSIALGADAQLRTALPGIHIDAETSRLLRDGRGILRTWRAEGTLRETVVIALGTNDGSETREWQADIDGMLEELPPGCRAVLVTPYLGRDDPVLDAAEIAAYYRALAQKLPYVTVADWAQTAAARPELLLGSDKTHLNGKNARQQYADTVALAVAEAGGKPGKI